MEHQKTDHQLNQTKLQHPVLGGDQKFSVLVRNLYGNKVMLLTSLFG
jgi:hypothetical protein